MWEDILKATFVLPKGTSVGKIKILMGYAIKLPKLETEFLEEKKSVEEKSKIWLNDNPFPKGNDKAEEQALYHQMKNKYMKGISTKKDDLEEQIKNYKNSNPFTETINSQGKYGTNKKMITVNGDGDITSDGYGDGFFNYEGPMPISIDEAAEHYKNTVVDYDVDKPYDSSETLEYREGGGRMPKKPKRRETVEEKPYDKNKKEPKFESREELQENYAEEQNKLNIRRFGGLFEGYDYEDFLPEEKPKVMTPSVKKFYQLKDKENQLRMLESPNKNQIGELSRIRVKMKASMKKIMTEVKGNLPKLEKIPSTFKTLTEIRTILQPRSNREIDDAIIILDKFFQGEPVDTGLSLDEILEIRNLIEATNIPIGENPIGRFINGLKDMVQIRTVRKDNQEKVIGTVNLNREGSVPATLQISNSIEFIVNDAELKLPIGKKYSMNEFNNISKWFEEKYTSIPKIGNYQNFMDKLVGDVFNATGIPTTEDMRSPTSDLSYNDITLSFMVEWLTGREQPLLTKLKTILSVIGGKKLNPSTKKNMVSRVINGQIFKNKNFIPLMSRYLFDPSNKDILTKKQADRLEKLLSEKVGNDTVIGLLLLVLDQTFSSKSTPKPNLLTDRLGVKPKKIIQPKGKIFDDKLRPDMSEEEQEKIRSERIESSKRIQEEKKKEQVKKADISSLPAKKRREVKAMLQNAHPTEYFGEDYLRLGKVINIIDGLAEDEEAELLEKLGVKNLQMVKTAASLRKKYEHLYEKLYNMVYDEEE